MTTKKFNIEVKGDVVEVPVEIFAELQWGSCDGCASCTMDGDVVIISSGQHMYCPFCGVARHNWSDDYSEHSLGVHQDTCPLKA